MAAGCGCFHFSVCHRVEDPNSRRAPDTQQAFEPALVSSNPPRVPEPVPIRPEGGPVVQAGLQVIQLNTPKRVLALC